MHQPDYEYEIIVTGSGPAGQRTAFQAEKIAAIVKKELVAGGSWNTLGTNPRQTPCEAVLLPSGDRLSWRMALAVRLFFLASLTVHRA